MCLRTGGSERFQFHCFLKRKIRWCRSDNNACQARASKADTHHIYIYPLDGEYVDWKLDKKFDVISPQWKKILKKKS
jgi:hypothetical protein